MDYDQKYQCQVSSVVEHQTDNLAVTGSNPVPNRLQTDNTNGQVERPVQSTPKGGECLLDQPLARFATLMAALKSTMQDMDSVVELARQRLVNGLTEES